MADYNAMYLKLFNSVTDAIKILQDAQLEAERMYMDHEPDIRLFKPDEQGDDDDV